MRFKQSFGGVSGRLILRGRSSLPKLRITREMLLELYVMSSRYLVESRTSGAIMKILTSAQMKEIDRLAIEEVGIPGPVLMENAGLQIFRLLQTILPYCDGDKIVVVAGKGNNGGDGRVIARHLGNTGMLPQGVPPP